ncbi:MULTISPECIES: DNA adenine methylase [unclassified Nocardia]|uniref:DNA adenine methylase n=1 Tax=unclassified Nocardia TaxID=2637762 RepID=UPI00278BDA26|nr:MULTISPECIES: DNA adenine methylase [unclassified Nocardia]
MTSSMGRLRSPVMYYGSKARIAEQIASMLPAHSHYVEACAGSLSVLLAKPRVRMETVNDLDGHLMTFWRVLRDRPEELERACALTPHARAEHYDARVLDDAEIDDVERARRVWVMLTQGRSGVLRTTGWRYARSIEGGFCGPARLSSYIERIAPTAERLRQVSLECRPAVEVLRDYGHGPRTNRTLIYVDPPYVGGVRARNYRVEATSAAAHIELAEAARAASATVVVSGYACELYDRELYPGWYRYELSAWTTQGDGRRDRTEVLWSNRPLITAGSTLEFRNSETADGVGCNETRCAAPGCAKVLTRASTGRPARFCSPSCRVRAHRARRSR